MMHNPYKSLRKTPWHKSIRWRGRRWYDPNERKVLWSSLSSALVFGVIRMAVFSLGLSHSENLTANSSPSVSPPSGILGTVHDLSRTGLDHATGSMEVCVFCHSPHQSAQAINRDIPEWNHVTTSSKFQMYASSSMKGSAEVQVMGPSLACLSCHDGSLAMGAIHVFPMGGGQNDYSQAQGGINPANGRMEGSSDLGTNLAAGHPVSVTYRDDLNTHLRPPSELKGVRLYPTNSRGARVQCTSCHDPHNFGVEGSTAPFLRVSKVGSALCLSCHSV